MGGTGTAAEKRPLQALLAGLGLALGAGDRDADRYVLSRVTDWGAVAGLARHHRVVTLFLQALRSNRIAVSDPEAERSLEDRRRRDNLRGLRQLYGMEGATRGLAEAGVPVLVLKGLPLGQRLYGDPFAKSSVDIDLLVPPADFAAAARVLGGLGWHRSLPDFPPTPARTRWADGVLDEHVFSGPGGKLDLHRNLLGNPFLFDPPFAALDANSISIEVAGRRFRTLGDADQLLYLACHGALHSWERLKWLCDLAMLVRRLGDDAVERAVARATAPGLTTAVASALRLCRSALHVETRAAEAAGRYDARVGLAVSLSQRTWTPRGGLRRLARKIAIRGGRLLIGGGAGFKRYEIRGLLIRSQDFGEVDLPDWLFWLYVPLRPLLWALRARRGRA